MWFVLPGAKGAFHNRVVAMEHGIGACKEGHCTAALHNVECRTRT